MSRRALQLAILLSAVRVGLAPAEANPLRSGAKWRLYPVEVPLEEREGKERREVIEQALIKALKKASFKLADPAAVEALRKRVIDEAGDVIDPITGRLDPAKATLFRERLATSLREELGCDAQLFASVELVKASLRMGAAEWDGTSQGVLSTGRMVGSLLGGGFDRGWVKALSLWLRVRELNGREIAFRSAGIETPLKFAVVKDVDVVPSDQWLRDPQRIEAAIASALGTGGEALRNHGTPAQGPAPSTWRRPAPK